MSGSPRGTSREVLAARIAAAFERCPEAAVLADRGVRLTGRQCLAQLEAFCRAVDSAVPPGGRVAVALPASAAQAFAILALICCRRVPVLVDWALAESLLAQQSFLDGLVTVPGSNLGRGRDLPRISIDRRGRVAAVEEAAAAGRRALPPGAAAILFTSGSLGGPKAVVLSVEGLLYTVEILRRRFVLDRRTIAAVALPLVHTMALNTQFLPTLLAGGRSVILAGDLGLGRMYRDIIASDATFVALFGDLLHFCHQEARRRRTPAAGSVTEVQLAGGFVLGEHLELARELFPNARIHKGYGLTEAIRVAMISSDDPRFADDTAGTPLSGQEVVIRDSSGRTLPPGDSGEIHVRGPNVMIGYDGRDPLPPGAFLGTGDRGHFTADGRLVIEGRLDRIFKSYGRSIAAPEVERAARASGQLAGACCVPVRGRRHGLRPLLFVEPTGGDVDSYRRPENRDRLEASLRASLARYKVPRTVVVVRSLPRSVGGKVRYDELELQGRTVAAMETLGRGLRGCLFKLLATAPTQGDER